MSIDAVAVLRIPNLPPPLTSVGPHPVEHRGDATLIDLMVRFDSADPDEHSLSLRRLVGPALDSHTDPRGILFFRDVKYPKAMAYDAIVSELSADGGVWAPKVEADYVPVRYRGSPRQPHDVLVGEMIAVLGRDRALELDMLSQVNKLMLVSSPDRRDAMQEYRTKLDTMTNSMGADFAQRYEASLEALIEAMRRAQETIPVRLDWWNDPASKVPAAYTEAPPNSHEALVGEMIKVMGREAVQLDMAASISRIILAEAGRNDLGAAESYRAQLDTVERAMGAEFTQRYDASLKQKVDALRADVVHALVDWTPPPDWLKHD